MTWLETLNIFVMGFALGYIWFPVWIIAKKIISEAQKARKEWKQ